MQCARDAGIDFEVLNACKQGSEGEGLVFQNALETDALVPRHTGVPWVVFNKVPLSIPRDITNRNN